MGCAAHAATSKSAQNQCNEAGTKEMILLSGIFRTSVNDGRLPLQNNKTCDACQKRSQQDADLGTLDDFRIVESQQRDKDRHGEPDAAQNPRAKNMFPGYIAG